MRALAPRVFVPTPRHTIKFEREYRHRTAVERINGLFDGLFDVKDIEGLLPYLQTMRKKSGASQTIIESRV